MYKYLNKCKIEFIDERLLFSESNLVRGDLDCYTNNEVANALPKDHYIGREG